MSAEAARGRGSESAGDPSPRVLDLFALKRAAGIRDADAHFGGLLLGELQKRLPSPGRT